MLMTDAVAKNLDRRHFLQAVAVGSGVAAVSRWAVGAERPAARTKMGMASDCWHVHDRAQTARDRRVTCRTRSFFFNGAISSAPAGYKPH